MKGDAGSGGWLPSSGSTATSVLEPKVGAVEPAACASPRRSPIQDQRPTASHAIAPEGIHLSFLGRRSLDNARAMPTDWIVKARQYRNVEGLRYWSMLMARQVSIQGGLRERHDECAVVEL